MERLSESQKQYLREATEKYHQSLPGSPAADYLTARGLGFPGLIKEQEAAYRLGYVADPSPGHEQFRGFLAVPYLRWSKEHGWMVVSIRFRCIESHDHKGHGKYMTVAGDRPRMYNTIALTKPSARIAITEGELDAITAESCGIRSVGIPGAQAWQPHFVEPFRGYREVFILADGDEAGAKFANTVASTLDNARTILMPPGEDVNSLVHKRGRDALKDRFK